MRTSACRKQLVGERFRLHAPLCHRLLNAELVPCTAAAEWVEGADLVDAARGRRARRTRDRGAQLQRGVAGRDTARAATVDALVGAAIGVGLTSIRVACAATGWVAARIEDGASPRLGADRRRGLVAETVATILVVRALEPIGQHDGLSEVDAHADEARFVGYACFGVAAACVLRIGRA